jgi:hypothetical protein
VDGASQEEGERKGRQVSCRMGSLHDADPVTWRNGLGTALQNSAEKSSPNPHGTTTAQAMKKEGPGMTLSPPAIGA